jgi:hypothetical protein
MVVEGPVGFRAVEVAHPGDAAPLQAIEAGAEFVEMFKPSTVVQIC